MAEQQLSGTYWTLIRQLNAISSLYRIYLAMRLWGSPEFQLLEGDDPEYLKDLAANKKFSEFVEDEKRELVASGIPATDEWLSSNAAMMIDFGMPLTTQEAQLLHRCASEMYPLLLRLEAKAEEIYRTESNPISLPALDGQAKKIADNITRFPGNQSPVIAEDCGITDTGQVRAIINKILKPRGFYYKNGYFPPKPL